MPAITLFPESLSGRMPFLATAGVRATDTLDVRVLRILLTGEALSVLNPDFREPIAKMAKKVGADEDTVRTRLRRLEDSGFITDWRLTLNPRLFGGGQVAVWFDLDPAASRTGLVEQLRLVPGVIFVHVMYDAAVVFVQYDDERVIPRTVELIRRLSGAPDVDVVRTAFLECQAVLAARDWDIVRALRKNPRKSYADLAAEVGLSSRTVRVRLTKLIAQGVAFAWPSLNMRAAQGGVLVHLKVWYPFERKAEVDESIATHLEPHLWHIMHMLPYHHGDLCTCGYNLMLPNVSAARDVLGWVGGVPGVEKARVLLHEDIYNFFDVYDEELERRLLALPTAMPKPHVDVTRKPPLLVRHN